MRFGICLYPHPQDIEPQRLAIAAEAYGFHTLWFPDHTHVPAGSVRHHTSSEPAPDSLADAPDVMISMAAAAAATSQLRIGSTICLITARHPIVTAKQAASVDRLSAGRLLFGVGAGWNERELADHGTVFASRYRLMHERVQAMKAIWANEVAEYHGDLVNFGPMHCGPKPTRPGGPPVLLGGSSERTMRRVARYADGWLPEAARLEFDLAESLRRFRGHCEAAGRSRQYVVIAAGPDPRPSEIASYEKEGVDEIYAVIVAPQWDAVERRMEELAARFGL